MLFVEDLCCVYVKLDKNQLNSKSKSLREASLKLSCRLLSSPQRHHINAKFTIVTDIIPQQQQQPGQKDFWLVLRTSISYINTSVIKYLAHYATREATISILSHTSSVLIGFSVIQHHFVNKTFARSTSAIESM